MLPVKVLERTVHSAAMFRNSPSSGKLVVAVSVISTEAAAGTMPCISRARVWASGLVKNFTMAMAASSRAGSSCLVTNIPSMGAS